MFTQLKIPTILGLFLVTLIVGVVALGSDAYLRTSTAASGSIAPSNVQMTNVSDTTFTVSWTTGTAATGAISITAAKTPAQVIFDDQDTGSAPVHPQLESVGKRLTHSVTFRGARPDTDYSIVILSNGKKAYAQHTTPYILHTPGALTSASGNLEPTYGTIIHADNTPVAGALVYITLEGSQTLSAATKQSGSWLVPLNLIRTQDLTSFLPITDRMAITVTVRGEGLETTAVTDTLNSSPIPDMMLGKTYDFRRASAKAPGGELALHTTPAPPKPPAAVLGTSTVKAAGTVALTIPAQGSAIPTTLPLIQGSGIPGKFVAIILGITSPLSGSATVGADGLWSYTPTKPVSPGKQSVTITTVDRNNKPVAITHLFEILKSGTQVLGDATASATLTPTITLAPLATTTATPIPTSTLAAQTPPTSGYELPTIILVLLGAGLMLGGGVALVK